MNMIKPFYASFLLALSLLTPSLVIANPTASQYQQVLNENLAENEPGVSVIISKASYEKWSVLLSSTTTAFHPMVTD